MMIISCLAPPLLLLPHVVTSEPKPLKHMGMNVLHMTACSAAGGCNQLVWSVWLGHKSRD
jgi:hypothetical protein